MRGTLVAKTWEWDPTLYAPPRYRKACEYEAFIWLYVPANDIQLLMRMVLPVEMSIHMY